MNNTTSSGVNDEELNRMIAGLKSSQASGSNDLNNSQSSQSRVVKPINSDSLAQQASEASANPTPNFGAQPENIAPKANNSAPKTTNDLDTPSNNDLNDLKIKAVKELKPLVDKLNLSPEDRFDTLLLLIRSTDDPSLISSAHQAAQNIADQTRKAQALLDIIKEIDFFNQK